MKKITILFWAALFIKIFPQALISSNSKIDEAFRLAITTIDKNTHDGILAAGADYGGEWTRDISINSWNCVNLLRPKVAKKSLWSVTINQGSIGHQYWDKIIWAIGALNYFKVNGDTAFLRQAYQCSKNTITQLENSAFDKSFGLFTGPSVFNDGIAGYPEPIFDKSISSSYVLDHKNSKTIKCLSTNCIYYEAYVSLYQMCGILKLPDAKVYQTKANHLRKNIIKYLYSPNENKFYYLIDNNGKKADYQEGLGISFAILFDILDRQDAQKIIANTHISAYGIASIYPDFPRYSAQKPGRHNNIIWPMVNGFWANACKQAGMLDKFYFELENLASLAIDKDKGNKNFREIYNPYSGKPDGGWQSDTTWESCNHQTWSATAFVSMIINGLFGLNFENDGIYFTPSLPSNLEKIELRDINYRDSKLNISISGNGPNVKSFKINDIDSKKYFIPTSTSGIVNIKIFLE